MINSIEKSEPSASKLSILGRNEDFNTHEDFCQNINHMLSRSSMGNPTFKCNETKSLGFEEYSKIFAAIQNLSLKNVGFSIEFYFGEILLCSINIHGKTMKIQITIFPKISQIFLQILALANSLDLKFLRVKTQKNGPISNDLQEFKEIYEIYETYVFMTEIEIAFDDVFEIINNNIIILNPDFSFEEFNILWDFFKKIPKDRITYEKITIKAKNFEFANMIESILNSPISFNYRFQVSLLECKALNCLFLPNLLKIMITFANKQIMRIHFEHLVLDLTIVSTFCEKIEVIFIKCPTEIFFSILPFFKEVKFTFENTTISFWAVKDFQEFYSKLQIIADFPLKMVLIELDPQNNFSFDDYCCIWEVMNSNSSKIEEIEFDFWGFKRDTMKIDFQKMKYPTILIFHLLEFLKPEKLVVCLDDSDPLKYNFNFNFSCKSLLIQSCDCFTLKNIPQTFFASFRQLKELSIRFLFGTVIFGSGELRISIPFLINFLINNNQNLEVLKIEVNAISFEINLPPKFLKNLFVLEMDFPSKNQNNDGIQEQIPFDNKIVTLKYWRFGSKTLIKDDSIFLKKFPYLTKANLEVREKSIIKRVVRNRLKFVIEALNLKKKLNKIFRKEIIAEIFTKMV